MTDRINRITANDVDYQADMRVYTKIYEALKVMAAKKHVSPEHAIDNTELYHRLGHSNLSNRVEAMITNELNEQ